MNTHLMNFDKLKKNKYNFVLVSDNYFRTKQDLK